MRLLTPSEKLFILENKALPKKEVERVAELLKTKFRFAAGRPNGNLIPVYLEKVVIEKDGKVDRKQEYIRRIARILDNANTELVAAAIEYALANKGVYEFKIPGDLMSKAKELAAAIVDNGFSFKEFAQWLDATKAYKNDAEEIMADGGIKDLNSLYTQLLGTANEASSLDGFIAVEKPTERINAFKVFKKLVDHLEGNYKAGTDYNVMADGSLTIDPEITAIDTTVSGLLSNLGDMDVKVGDFGGTNEAKTTGSFNRERAGELLSYDGDQELDAMIAAMVAHGAVEGQEHDMIDWVDGVTPTEAEESEWTISDFLSEIGYKPTTSTNEASHNPVVASGILAYDENFTPDQMVAAIAAHGNPDDLIDHVDGVTPIEDEEGKWTVKDFLAEIGYKINEGRMQIKRAYKRNGVELAPAVTVAEEAVMRNKIVKFLGGQPLFRASKASILEFFNALNEDAEVGRVPSAGWLYRNSHLVKKIRVGKDSFYKLTRAGLNLFNKLNKTVNEDIDDAPAPDEQEGQASVLRDLLGNLNDLRDEIDATPEGEVKILIPHYSINVQSKYEDGEELQNELDEVENDLGHSLIVNDYDDLVADPHGVLSEAANERKRGEAHEGEVVDALLPYYALVQGDKGFTNLQIGRGGKVFTFETAEEVPHHYEDGQKEIQKFEVGTDGDDIYCLFVNNGDEQNLKSPDDLKEYTGAGSANEAMTEAEMEATKDWFSTLGEEERDGFISRYQDETGKSIGDFQGDDKDAVSKAKAFWKWLAGEQQMAMQEAVSPKGSYEIVVMGEDQDTKMALKDAIEQKIPDNITIAGDDFGVIINDDIDRQIFDREFGRLADSSGLQVQAFQNDSPIDLKPHAEMVKESVDANEYFTVQQPTREQMVTYRALQMYLKRHYTNKDYSTTSSGTLRIKKAIQEKLTPYLKSLDVIQPGTAK